MEPQEEKTEILVRVFSGLFPNAPFDIATLAERTLAGMESVGWTMSYDEEFTRRTVERIVNHVTTAHPTPPPFVPPRPPERLAGT